MFFNKKMTKKDHNHKVVNNHKPYINEQVINPFEDDDDDDFICEARPIFKPTSPNRYEGNPIPKVDKTRSAQVAVFDSPVVGAVSCFIEHSDDPEKWDENCYGAMIDVDNPAFQKAVQDITIYDKDLNIIADKSNIGAIGFAVKEEYARPMVDAVDSLNSIIRCKYNQIYGLQKNIVEL